MNKKNNLKILIINYEYPPLGGGGGVASRDLAIEWVKHAQVDVITSSFKGLKKFEVVNNVNVHRVKIFFRKSRDAASFLSMLTYLPGAFLKGIKLIKKNKYSVLNTHFVIPSGPAGYLLGKIFKIPNVVSLHGGEIYDPSKKLSPHRFKFFLAVVKYLLNKGDRLVAQSSNTRDNAIQYYNPKKEIDIIPLPFHPPQMPDVTRRDLEIEKSDFILITCGRIVKRKAMDVIIKALSKIPDEKIKLIKFYIMGNGPEKNNLENLSKELGLENKVIFLGYVEDEEKFARYNNADVFILTSLHEGFGIVYMEAMYCGLPIICSNNGGQVDFLKNEKNALLIDVGDVDGCVKSILKIYNDKELYKKLSENNKEKVKDFYGESVAGEYIKIFKEIIAK